MKNEVKFYEQGLEEYPKAGVVFGNFMILRWIVLGTIACWFLYPLAAWIYLGFTIIMVYIVMRKLVCVNCYYYDKRCSIGWGKLSALFFKKGHIEEFSTSSGVKFAPIIHRLLSLVPLVLIIISLIQKFSIHKLIILLLLLLVFIYSELVGRKKSCVKCKMKTICLWGAVK